MCLCRSCVSCVGVWVFRCTVSRFLGGSSVIRLFASALTFLMLVVPAPPAAAPLSDPVLRGSASLRGWPETMRSHSRVSLQCMLQQASPGCPSLVQQLPKPSTLRNRAAFAPSAGRAWTISQPLSPTSVQPSASWPSAVDQAAAASVASGTASTACGGGGSGSKTASCGGGTPSRRGCRTPRGLRHLSIQRLPGAPASVNRRPSGRGGIEEAKAVVACPAVVQHSARCRGASHSAKPFP